MIPEFKAIEWFNIPGRGRVVTVELDRDYKRSTMTDDLKNVIVDGVSYEVIGVESFAVEHQWKGGMVGLLVKDAPPGTACEKQP